jgi:hypothetical protein
MKNILLLLTLSIGLGNLLAQNGLVKPFGACGPYDKPLHATVGETIRIECDSAVIINQARYKLYERAGLAVLSYDPSFYEDIVNEFQEKGMVMQAWADSLNKSYTRLSLSYSNTLTKTEQELNTMQTNIKEATLNLDQAKNNLDNALKNLNKARWEKWLWAAGGIVVGGMIVAVAN